MTGVPAAPESGVPLPVGFRLCPDRALRLLEAGRVLLGGAPFRLLRLGPRGAAAVEEWLRGAPVGEDLRLRRLARALVEAGMLHPLPPDDGPRPDVTIVIPVHGREAQLARCLDSLAGGRSGGCPTPPVVVVDDGSDDGGAIREVTVSGGGRYLRRGVRGGPAAARNTGLADTTAELVAFVDSDCVVPPGWLDRLAGHFADPLVGAAAPRIVALPAAGAGLLAAYEADRSPLDRGCRPSLVRPGTRVPFVPAAALLVRRSALGAGFDEALVVGEDVDLVWRLGEAGWNVRYDPSVEVAHEHRLRFGDWLERRLEYGTSAAPLAERHPQAVAAVVISPLGAAAWLALAAGAPLAALTAVGAASALLARRIARVAPAPRRLATALVGRAVAEGGPRLAEAVMRSWWPLLLPLAAKSGTCRRVVAVAALARAAGALPAPAGGDGDHLREPGDPRDDWVVELAAVAGLRLLDDCAYTVGVWLGCLRHRTVRPLLPRRTTSPRRVGPVTFGG